MKWLKEVDGELWLTEDDRENLKLSYRVKKVIHAEQSPFQHVMILDTYDFGPTLVLDGVIQTTSIDGFIYNEMITHIPMMTHPKPENVLIIGGGDCGVAREVVKYDSVTRVDMVEIDELVVKLSKKHLPEVSGNLSDPRVNFIYADGTKHVRNQPNQYDVVIIDSSDPIGPATQLFSLEFYTGVAASLKADGLMVCQSQSPIFHMDIVNETQTKLKTLFPHTDVYTAVVPTYPGGLWSFSLGSKKYTPESIATGWDKAASYVNADILERCFSIPEFMKQALK
ncbi:polyamine aminopropyltransferase [Desulfuribacillus alkaliarsenatis]|uniref:Polyamine aminopropyltransferase n=1 Tax=Desulfuribacillus alkaliarsenatis TaxID=766136 RepID=A0A1E5G1H1_9FIRM|nr:polyamine aminopropyltransferase [Desulfuribacillus alkaliarsenatis]OEF96713.1 spermidine synthase [Desulfuribacillus alkaliarsenatis]